VQGFVGRETDIAALRTELNRVRESGRGALVILKGRRRVGKSWLVEEFIEQSGTPAVFFLADRVRSQLQLDRFAQELAQSNLPMAASASGIRFETWEAALTYASANASAQNPSVIVLDEFPYLMESDDPKVVEGIVNAVWERVLSRLPVMLVLVGSDFSVMNMLSEHDRPLFDRPTLTRTIRPLNVAEFADISGLTGAAAIDAYHVVGGFPRLATLWKPGWTLQRFLTDQIVDQDSPLVAIGRRILDAEFPSLIAARSVLSVIGAGERTYGNIAKGADLASSNLKRSLELLDRDKLVVTADLPLSAVKSEETRYYISDPYLRFYLRFIDPGLADIIRGRGRSVVNRIARDWQTYLGRAIEPFVRQSLERLEDDRVFGATRVGGYWTRSNIPEIDLVGLDDEGPSHVRFVGSIKWRDNSLFAHRDTRDLLVSALPDPNTGLSGVPGMTSGTPLIGVSRCGFTNDVGLGATVGPDDLLSAWRKAANTN
jgi:AAA+ ATPase superfamily predicted ATPase